MGWHNLKFIHKKMIEIFKCKMCSKLQNVSSKNDLRGTRFNTNLTILNEFNKLHK